MATAVAMAELVGKRWHLHGADGHCFAVREHGQQALRFFEAVEKKDDGYRSCLDWLDELSVGEARERGLVFSAAPVALAWCRSRETESTKGLCLVDGDGHEWLRLGTDHDDDYYPSFVFTWTPKQARGAN